MDGEVVPAGGDRGKLAKAAKPQLVQSEHSEISLYK